MFKNFIKLNKEEREQSLIDDSVERLNRAVERKRMALEDELSDAKAALRKTRTITTLEDLNPDAYIAKLSSHFNKVKLAEALLKNFNDNFAK